MQATSYVRRAIEMSPHSLHGTGQSDPYFTDQMRNGSICGGPVCIVIHKG